MIRRFKKMAVVAALVLSVPTVSFSASEIELIMWEMVSVTDDISHVESFIDAFPDSEHAQEALAIAKRLKSNENAVAMEDSIFAMVGNVTYSAPIAFGDQHIIGRTLPELLEASPAFPPVEGLAEEHWKDKTCQSCHSWTRESLCTQATTYVSKEPDSYRNKAHPFGGLLKINLRNWAQNSCE